MPNTLTTHHAAASAPRSSVPSFDALPDSALVRESQLVRDPKYPDRPVLLQISQSTLSRYVRAGKFPRPVKLSNRVTVYRVGDVRTWMQARVDDAIRLAS